MRRSPKIKWRLSTTHGPCRGEDQQQQLARREEQLWQRQEALWQQQLAHWQHERQIWAQREAALLATIQDLHTLLTTTSSRHIQIQPSSPSLQIEPAAPSSQAAQQANALHQNQPVSTSAQAIRTTTEPQASSAQRISVPLDDSEPADPSVKPGGQDDSSAGPGVRPQQGPPPPLSIGNDDIYWVHQLQSGLMAEGYYCGEEEMEDFVFGSGTESAVLSFQVKSQLSFLLKLPLAANLLILPPRITCVFSLICMSCLFFPSHLFITICLSCIVVLTC